MTLSLGTAYRSFGGEVEASSSPTLCRLPASRRHQLWAIAPAHEARGLSQTALPPLQPLKPHLAHTKQPKRSIGWNFRHSQRRYQQGTLPQQSNEQLREIGSTTDMIEPDYDPAVRIRSVR